MASPSVYFPDTFTLSDGPVQLVETSPVNPRVKFDGLGLAAYDASGAVLINLDAVTGSAVFAGTVDIAGGILIPPSSSVSRTPNQPPPDANSLDWGTSTAKAVSLAGFADAGSPGHSTTESIAELSVYDLNTLAQLVSSLTLAHTPWLGTKKRTIKVRVLNDAGTAFITKTILASDGSSDLGGAGVPWIPLPFAANWVDNASLTDPPAAYYSDGDHVWLTGVAKNNASYSFGTASAVIATLPVGSRPATRQDMIIPTNDASNGRGFMELACQTNGDLQLVAQWITGASGSVGSQHRLVNTPFRLT